MKLLLRLLVLLTLSGCMGVQNVRYAYNSKELNDNNSGVILGSEASGAGVSFLNLETNKEIEYLGAKVFCMRLPIGRYSLYIIGGRTANFGSENPFVFEVKKSDRIYIGTIVKSWLNPKQYNIEKNKIASIKGYQFGSRLIASGGRKLSLYGEPYKIIVVNNINDVAGKYEKDCPGLSMSEVSISPMK